MNDVKLRHEKGGDFSLIINGSTEISIAEYSIRPEKGRATNTMPLILNLSLYCNPETSTIEIVPRREPGENLVGVPLGNQSELTDAEKLIGGHFDGEKWVFDILLEAKRRGSPQARQLFGD